MATPPESVRAELALVTATAASEIRNAAPDLSSDPLQGTLEALGLLVPSFYDAAGALAVDWYDERRTEASPSTAYAPTIIGDPATDWIDREVEKLMRSIEDETQRAVDEAVALAEKEVARGFRDSILGNLRSDEDALGWSRVARPGACKFCSMLADKGCCLPLGVDGDLRRPPQLQLRRAPGVPQRRARPRGVRDPVPGLERTGAQREGPGRAQRAREGLPQQELPRLSGVIDHPLAGGSATAALNAGAQPDEATEMRP